MKKIKLLIAAVAMVGLASSSSAFADGFMPGEGLYIGGFAAGGMGIVQPKVTTKTNNSAAVAGNCEGGCADNKNTGGTDNDSSIYSQIPHQI